MKALRLSISHIGIIEDAVIAIDKPAKIPEQVGAFVVEGGKVKSETLFK